MRRHWVSRVLTGRKNERMRRQGVSQSGNVNSDRPTAAENRPRDRPLIDSG